MKLEILQVPDCPNVALLEERIHRAMPGIAVEIVHRIIATPEQASAQGMTGSPTLLVYGSDPFATADQAPSVSCRLYPTTDGRLDGAPSVEALRQALAGDRPRGHDLHSGGAADPADTCCDRSSQAPPAAELSRSRAAAQPGSRPARLVHRAILRSFVATGQPPEDTDIAELLAEQGISSAAVLRELHDADVIRLDDRGRVAAAYPFSSVPTRHRVHIGGGATAYAMCAIDALGIASMLGTDVGIHSTDASTDAPISVQIVNRQLIASPDTTVVYIGGNPGAGPSADTCCTVLNFFTDRATAIDWAERHPAITGTITDLDDARALGDTIFADLLTD